MSSILATSLRSNENGSIHVSLIFFVRIDHGVDGLEDTLQRGPEKLRHRIAAVNPQPQKQTTVSLLVAVEPEAESAELKAKAHCSVLVLVEVDTDVRLDGVGGCFLLFLTARSARRTDFQSFLRLGQISEDGVDLPGLQGARRLRLQRTEAIDEGLEPEPAGGLRRQVTLLARLQPVRYAADDDGRRHRQTVLQANDAGVPVFLRLTLALLLAPLDLAAAGVEQFLNRLMHFRRLLDEQCLQLRIVVDRATAAVDVPRLGRNAGADQGDQFLR